MSRPIALAYIACAVIWGTAWYAIRVCIGPGGYDTIVALALRFAIAAGVLLPIALRARPWPRARGWWPFVIAGVLDAIGYSLVYYGERRISGGIAAVVYGTQPLVLALLVTATRMERITSRHIGGAVISLAGVAVLLVDRFEVSVQQGLGVALVLVSVVVSTVYLMIMKRHGGSVPNVVATEIFLAVTALVLIAVAVVAGAPIGWPSAVAPTIALLYLAVFGSVVAFLCYFWLLERSTMVVASTLVLAFPIVALATDAAFERAITLGARTYAGAAITLAGLAVSLQRRGARFSL
jgi:drug/metabolite transporter (DMT)-like permease